MAPRRSETPPAWGKEGYSTEEHSPQTGMERHRGGKGTESERTGSAWVSQRPSLGITGESKRVRTRTSGDERIEVLD